MLLRPPRSPIHAVINQDARPEHALPRNRVLRHGEHRRVSSPFHRHHDGGFVILAAIDDAGVDLPGVVFYFGDALDDVLVLVRLPLSPTVKYPVSATSVIAT